MGVDVDGGYLDSATARADMLGQVEAAIDNAAATGVYVLVDWHSHAAHTQESEAVAFFADISERYGQLPNVLFETYNEPLDVSWAATLKPYHEAVLQAIRGSDPDTHPNVVILGTPNWDQDVDAVIGNPVAGTNLMYTVHFYSCTHNAASGHLGVAQSALNAGVPIFVTEWGATDAAGGTGGTPVCAAAADGWHTWMNANRISSAAWKLDDCDFEVESTGTADTSCLLAKDAPVSGGWAASDLNGHGSYVVQQLRE
jgi:endoglucanase